METTQDIDRFAIVSSLAGSAVNVCTRSGLLEGWAYPSHTAFPPTSCWRGHCTGTGMAHATPAHSVDRIVDAVLALLERGTPQGLSYRRIAERAGLSSGTVAYYFPTRTSLLELGLEEHHRFVASFVGRLKRASFPSAGQFVRMVVRHSFRRRGENRLQILSWAEQYQFPAGRLARMSQLLERAAGDPWSTSFSQMERRVIIQSLAYGVQRFAALSDEELVALVGASDPEKARDAVVETMGRLGDLLSSGSGP